MPETKLHDDEVDIDVTIVKHLIAKQFPQYDRQVVSALVPSGTDNKMFKLGLDKIVRLPRTSGAVASLQKEEKWLPIIGENLPTAVPIPIHAGEPTKEYPFPWLIIPFISGSTPGLSNPLDGEQAAFDLAKFIGAMQQQDTNGAPLCTRGQHIKNRDSAVRKSVELLGDEYDLDQLLEIWNDSVNTPRWEGPSCWIHGDLHVGNILSNGGKINAIVDFGLCGVGEPSCDFMPAWTLLKKENREKFRSLINADENCWKRARGWAFSMGVLGYPYYKNTNPIFASIAKNAMDQAIADFVGY
ncbi:MAG: aminoglycoside phosphotransferase family protein [Oligoflexales bacterium]